MCRDNVEGVYYAYGERGVVSRSLTKSQIRRQHADSLLSCSTIFATPTMIQQYVQPTFVCMVLAFLTCRTLHSHKITSSTTSISLKSSPLSVSM